ncbi:MAG: haloacid dehalogenase [Sulfurimonas sp.]|nr:haloacid dehalogenase [Sulfurimonas sp.]MBU3939178.1 haloacid dehalogenase [bacterium]MBU4024156.1 haloacid dehalogenase [bacterium]MBU4059409.1 haloacid dehalogenase [bacterium]MBU4111150.1 haloacid dehalogenase [bacterium]
MIEIPNFKNLEILNIVCDYNGTIAKDGIVLDGIQKLFTELSKSYKVFVITADTFGSVQTQLKGFGAEIKILSSSEHTKEKADFIYELGAKNTIAIGNGNNDALMMQNAVIGIAILGDEGCAKETLFNADVICKNSIEALELILQPKRLIATLRR